ncbi:patatin-like phospholipase family protein [Polynucleobacter sp. MWH-Spelu-300-X4]|uniref:patatin-like phospholipase family protein n=1 Tax=Polynucleobacter sp. MWH-Spelu-300-X4 TaxID=2689109 RepID=UPI002040841D|nr:patatin-like phospholipase family protein [Polynucleobacter sp. MWH-Spelu-300-X4]
MAGTGVLSLSLLGGCSSFGSKKPKIGLALGGGAARGFAHIGVIKALEAQGIKPDLVVGTSAGSVIAALYASGNPGTELNRMALTLDEASITDWALPFSGKFGGMIKGDALQSTVNRLVKNQRIENMPIPLGIVATDLQTGAGILFQRGDTGQAVRASCSVPGVFQPSVINGREYVDGGLVSPVPVRYAKQMGADFVIAVNISTEPSTQDTSGTLGVLLQTTSIMGQSINHFELENAQVVVRPQLGTMKGTDFKSRNAAILAGEEAAMAQMSQIKYRLGMK